MNDSRGLLPAATTLGRSAVTVGDAAAVVAFYRNVVGLAVHTRTASRTVLGTGERPLLELRHDDAARARPADAAGLFHNAFCVPSRAALADTLGRIRSSEWDLTGASDHGVSEALYLQDPEGNGVEIYRDRPREEWPRDDAGGVEIGSWPLDLAAVAAAGGVEASEPASESSEAETTEPTNNGVPPETTLGHVHLEVTSLEAARRFYAETLGFGVKTAVPNALFVAAGDYHHHLGLNTWNGRSAAVSSDTRGLDWFELVVPSSDALGAIRRRLADADADVAVEDRDDGLEVADPDGIRIRLRAEQ